MSLWIKLDMDWQSDPKILDAKSRYGKAFLFDVVNLFCALGEFSGLISLQNSAEKLHLENKLGKRGKSLKTFLERCAECQIINGEWLKALGKVGSERSLKDGTARAKRRECAKDASDAAAASRASKRTP